MYGYIHATENPHRATQICDHRSIAGSKCVKPEHAQKTIEVGRMTERARLVSFEQIAYCLDTGDAIYVFSESFDRSAI